MSTETDIWELLILRQKRQIVIETESNCFMLERKSCSESQSSGAGCSKLTTSLVNVSLKFQMLIS